MTNKTPLLNRLNNLSRRSRSLAAIAAVTLLGVSSIAFPSQAFAANPLCRDEALQIGNSGTCVKYFQNAIHAHGYDPGTIDGLYGTNTANAVKKFQSDRGLSATGAYTPQQLEPHVCWNGISGPYKVNVSQSEFCTKTDPNPCNSTQPYANQSNYYATLTIKVENNTGRTAPTTCVHLASTGAAFGLSYNPVNDIGTCGKSFNVDLGHDQVCHGSQIGPVAITESYYPSLRGEVGYVWSGCDSVSGNYTKAPYGTQTCSMDRTARTSGNRTITLTAVYWAPNIQ